MWLTILPFHIVHSWFSQAYHFIHKTNIYYTLIPWKISCISSHFLSSYRCSYRYSYVSRIITAFPILYYRLIKEKMSTFQHFITAQFFFLLILVLGLTSILLVSACCYPDCLLILNYHFQSVQVQTPNYIVMLCSGSITSMPYHAFQYMVSLVGNLDCILLMYV